MLPYIILFITEAQEIFHPADHLSLSLVVLGFSHPPNLVSESLTQDLKK